jgi:hypothetical protein
MDVDDYANILILFFFHNIYILKFCFDIKISYHVFIQNAQQATTLHQQQVWEIGNVLLKFRLIKNSIFQNGTIVVCKGFDTRY